MERESFEDEEVAALMNEHYVAIKVDREERPDVDHIYMTVCQALTGSGGWPLTVVMTPDQKPFYAGTYFPKYTRQGRIGLMDVLSQLADKWENDRERVLAASADLIAHVEPHVAGTAGGDVRQETLDDAYRHYLLTFDAAYGGFASAPKFPGPHNLVFLTRYGLQMKEDKALEMVKTSLDAMRAGGIYDHIGQGFSRYSVDSLWLVPHFEKMLYDNALLTYAYIEAYQATGEERYAQTAEDIITYVLRDMTSLEGGFYSAEDADSEGVEGKFYVWSVDEVLDVLGEDAGQRYCRYYQMTVCGNFEGHNIPNRIDADEAAFLAAEDLDAKMWAMQLRIDNARLYEVREKRVHPHKDDKVLTAWNGLMIAALAKVGAALGRDEYVAAAARAVQFVRTHLRRPDGRLLARYRDGESLYLAYVDDYADLIWGLIELYEASFDAEVLTLALTLQDDMIRLFWDETDGGFYVYGSDGESLIFRPKEIYDGAMPSGNSVAAWNLLRLARMTGQTEYETFAQRLFAAFAGAVEDHPAGYSMYLIALQFALRETSELVVAGCLEDADAQAAKAALAKLYLPDAVKLFHPAGFVGDAVRKRVPFIEHQTMQDGKTTVYVCKNFSCQAPTTDWRGQFARLQKGLPNNV